MIFILFLIRLTTAILVGWCWHKGMPAYAIGLAVFFILEAIAGLRDRINDIYWSKLSPRHPQ